MASRFTQACRGALLAFGLMAATLAQAANDYYLQIEGIPGESTDRDHKDWIDIESFSWGLTLVAGSAGGGGAGTAGKAKFSDFAWMQFVDSSTPKWFTRVATGKHTPKVTLDVTRTTGGRGESFFQMVFTDTIGTGLQVSGGGGGNVMATASMDSGATVLLRYRPQDPKGGMGKWVEGSFSIKANSPTALFSGDENALLGLFSAGGSIVFDSGAVTPVPEPTSAALLLAGVGLLALKRRRAA